MYTCGPNYGVRTVNEEHGILGGCACDSFSSAALGTKKKKKNLPAVKTSLNPMYPESDIAIRTKMMGSTWFIRVVQVTGSDLMD